MTFSQARRKLDELVTNGVYHALNHDLVTYMDKSILEQKNLYVKDLGWFYGKTFEESFQKLEEKLAQQTKDV